MEKDNLSFSLIINEVGGPRLGRRAASLVWTFELLNECFDHVFSFGWHHKHIDSLSVVLGLGAVCSIKHLCKVACITDAADGQLVRPLFRAVDSQL